MARSRWMWPRPIGLESQRTRRAAVRRGRAGGVFRSSTEGTVPASTGRSRTKSRIRRFALTACRPCRLWPAPSKVTRRAPGMAATIFSACVYGTILSRVPCSASVGTETRGSRSCTLAPSMARRDSMRTSGVVSPAHATPVLDALERVRLGEDAGEQALAVAREVAAHHARDLVLEGLGHRLRVLAAEQDQVRHAARVLDHVAERDQGRAGIGGEGEGRPHRLFQHREQVAVAAVEVVARRRPLGASIAPRVGGDDAEVAREVRDLRLELPAVDHGLALGEEDEVAAPLARGLPEQLDAAAARVHGPTLRRWWGPSPRGSRRSGWRETRRARRARG